MKNKKVIIDRIKDAIILLLSLLTVFLLSKTMLFSKDSMETIKEFFVAPNRSSINFGDDKGMLASSIMPDVIVITDKKGNHYAIKYSAADLTEAYSSFSASFAEAMGTAGASQQIKSADFKNALSEHYGVFFDFPANLPISVLAESLRTDASNSIKNFESCRFYLCLDNEDPYLYFIDSDRGNFYRCESDISVSYFTSKLENYQGKNDLFVFENHEYDDTNIDRFFAISDKIYQLPGLTVQSPVSNELKADYLLKTFKMSERTSTQYTESDGSTTYVDGTRSMRLEKNGDISYTTNGESAVTLIENHNNHYKKEMLIPSAVVFLQKNFVPYIGESILIYSGMSEENSKGSVNLYFDYFISGIQIGYPEGSHAFELEINDGKIIKASIKLRSYTTSGITMYPLPDKQLTAAMKESGGIPNLKYMDSPQGVTLGWYLN